MSEKEAVIISATRTPIGKFLGNLKSFSATQLGALVVREAVRRAGLDPDQIDEVIMGNVLSAGLGQNPARQAALRGGLPTKVAALTLNKVCGSGLKAVMLAEQAIKTGDAEIIVAGGMESMSNAPYLMSKAREGYRLGHGEILDSMIQDGLWDAFENCHMGCTGEAVAEKYRISRGEQDAYALNSHQKALVAIKAELFKEEIVAVEIPQKKGASLRVDVDEGPRADTTLDVLGKLKPAFKEGGTVTAGNAPGVNDGAAAVVVMGRGRAEAMRKKPLARIVAQATSGLDPLWVMMAPVDAVRKVLQKAGWQASDVHLVELNEAFSVQAVAVSRELGLNPDIVNVHGGAVALGHPIGASGARVLVTLLHALKSRNQTRGVAALCLGGGNAVAMAVERI
ncbi:MAG: acetyl-CoA C-acetyltransferase [Acidobacteria bacterium]|nr:acetyl-CoA C-acetyltransferase [Acidobacteriota bacterium]MBI3658044.1 acetyl-CoA C-acetyltransferase [Acidobacteriota bacterium]